MSVNRQKLRFWAMQITVFMPVTSLLMSESCKECMWCLDLCGPPFSLGPTTRFQSETFTHVVRFLQPQMSMSWITWRLQTRTIQAGFVKSGVVEAIWDTEATMHIHSVSLSTTPSSYIQCMFHRTACCLWISKWYSCISQQNLRVISSLCQQVAQNLCIKVDCHFSIS